MYVPYRTREFADAATARIQSNDYQLIVRQGPQSTRINVGKEEERKPVDPPFVIELKISSQPDLHQNYIKSTNPCLFEYHSSLAGTLVTSLQHSTDKDNNGGAIFVFDDLSVKVEGKFRLRFDLFEMGDDQCSHIKSVTSDPFIVRLAETSLTRFFRNLGVWGPASDDSYAQPLHQDSQLHIGNQDLPALLGLLWLPTNASL
ncbi:hypothetical protein DL98DRAFT_541203 [Cadophora sp. DSE1049]|nr:hypothetical protein DL98DRAFT_541203 [Cadophora sp. DSE1049]